MDQASATRVGVVSQDATKQSVGRAERTFSFAIVVSGIRCLLAYVILPFFSPLLAIAPGVSSSFAIAIGAVAIGANVFSLRRFWRIRHPWRRVVTVLHVAMIGFLLVLIVIDVVDVIS